jgi:oligopeptide transport system substrate-binding protein
MNANERKWEGNEQDGATCNCLKVAIPSGARSRVHLRLIAAILVAFVVVTGCARHSSRLNSSNTLREPMTLEPATFDPARVTEGGTGGMLQNIYEGLVDFDKNNRIIPILAVNWEISPGGRCYTFHLRPNARFHNGRALNAADVKYSLERALWPETRSSSALNYLGFIQGAEEVAGGKRRDLAGVEVMVPLTVRITLTRPRGYFLQALSYATGWIVCKEAIEKNRGILNEKAAIGTGPFMLEGYRHGARVTLTANPNYWGGRPPLERIERPIVLDPNTRHLMYENGELDVIAIGATDFKRDKENPALQPQLVEAPAASVIYLCIHPHLLPVFKDVRVRKAVAHAIDKDELVGVASHGLWKRADSLLPPGLLGYNPAIRRIAYDPAGARSQLAAAGFPGGKGFPRITLVYTQNQPERTSAAQIIRSRLKENLGIEVALQEREGAIFVSERRAEKMPFYFGVWDADYPDPQNFLSTLLRTGAPLNSFGYSNPKLDALVDSGDSETDPNKRALLYAQADQIAMDDVALFPLVNTATRLLVKPYVKGFEYNLIGVLPHRRTATSRK